MARPSLFYIFEFWSTAGHPNVAGPGKN